MLTAMLLALIAPLQAGNRGLVPRWTLVERASISPLRFLLAMRPRVTSSKVLSSLLRARMPPASG